MYVSYILALGRVPKIYIFTRVALICNLLVPITHYISAIPIAYRIILVVPSVGLTNIMACRVFRHTKLGLSSGVRNVSTMIPQSHPTMPVFINSQRGGLTTGSVPRNELLHTSSINDTDDTEVPSSGNSAEKLPHYSKEGVSAV
jgi:hypothetical protein